MLKGYQRGSIEISTGVTLVIIVAIVAAVSAIITMEYYETPSIVSPVATAVPKLTPAATNQLAPEKIISSEVIAENCKIKINTTKGEVFLETGYSEFSPQAKCYQFLLNKTSPSGKYVVFQDISGGVDSLLKVYSLERNDTVQLAIYGTSNIFDISFLPDDSLVSLFGYKDIYAEQYLGVYDISGLFAAYPSGIDKQYKYFTNLNEYSKNTTLPDIGKNYFSLSASGGKLKIYGTGGTGTGILKEYSFSELVE